MAAPIRPCFRRRCFGLTAVAVLTALATGSAGAQTAAPPPGAPQPQPAAAPAPRENPGLVNEIGRLLKDPSSLLPDFVKPDSSADKTPDPAPSPPAAPQQPAAAVQPAPPPASAPPPKQPAAIAPAPPPPPAPSQASPMIPAIINGREICPASANGGADCAAGAAVLCRSRGYQSGRSLAVDATEKCSAKLLIPGRAREPGDCRTENFVTRAWCQ
ncbi:hypothetical protein [Rhodopseudomonas pseudopalustris]|nr:hypothetical protein [Rhodopseudomonas pseudopalustris]